VTSSQPTAAALAAATPEGRDRWIDFLRAFSIGAVVFGHWLVAVVVWEGGSVEGFNALERIPVLALTWLLQVMPLFFFVGASPTW
jgi:fucose 4-O-acetylase-like acetyltransferase